MKVFKNVYFRINTPSYYKNKYGVGFGNEEERENFHNTITELFVNSGWEIKKEKYKSSGGCNTVIKDKQELYLHPQSISGVILEENISEIEELLSNSDLFKFEKTDIYDDVYDITDEQYMDILKSKKDEIEKDILVTYKTKRKNLFITDSFSPLMEILKKYRIKRLTHHVGVISSNNPDVQYMCELFESLVTEGKLITAQTKLGTGYRSVA